MIRFLVSTVSVLSLWLLACVTTSAQSARQDDFAGQIVERQECASDDERLDREFFVICYRPDWKIPIWVGYQLLDNQLNGSVERTDNFRRDPGVLTQAASPADYKGSDYDRGHMAPASVFRGSYEAMSATFLMSNMAPQTPALNRGSWRAIEAAVSDLKRAGGDVWVFTGNLMLTDQYRPGAPEKFIGANNIAVPTHSFKAVLRRTPKGEWEAYGFVAPNWFGGLPKDVSSFLVSIDNIETMSGLDFFSVLPDEIENPIEGRIPKWPAS